MKFKRFRSCSMLTAMVVLLLFFTKPGQTAEAQTPADSAADKWAPFALLVIDIQHYFWNDMLARDFPDFPENIKGLLDLCRSEGIDIIHLRARFEPDMSDWPSYFKLQGKIPCVRGTPGEIVQPFAKEKPGEKIIYKHSFDGFLDTALADYLRQNNKQHLLVAGVDTGVCVITTCFSAFQRGFLLTLLEDCCAGEINAHRFITQSYNGFIFESIGFKEIPSNYSVWLIRLNRLKSIEKRID